jgi:hypothetical protein
MASLKLTYSKHLLLSFLQLFSFLSQTVNLEGDHSEPKVTKFFVLESCFLGHCCLILRISNFLLWSSLWRNLPRIKACVLWLLALHYGVLIRFVRFSSRCWVICSPYSRFVNPTSDVLIRFVRFSSRCWVICSPYSRFVNPTSDVLIRFVRFSSRCWVICSPYSRFVNPTSDVLIRFARFSSRCWVICSPYSRFVNPTSDVYSQVSETFRVSRLSSPSFAIWLRGRVRGSPSKGFYCRNSGVAVPLFLPLENGGPSLTRLEEYRNWLHLEKFQVELNRCVLLSAHTGRK